MNGTAYNSRLHKFSIFLSACVFLLIVAGALVTSNDAGLAVPDWPTSFGSMYKVPPMVGGVKYEHGHRMLAQFVGFLTIVLTVWTQRTDRRSWVRKLGWLALVLVVVQGVLGGITVKMLLPWYVSSAHAMVGQTYFALLMLMSVFLGYRWIETPPMNAAPSPGTDLRYLSVAGIVAVYIQLFLGAAFRHGGMHFLPHLVWAAVTTGILLWTCLRALTGYGMVRTVKGMASAVLGLLFIQLVLGFGAYITRVVWGKDAPQPMPSMVATTVLHTAVGALVLAHCFMLAVFVFRHVKPVPSPALAVDQSHKAAA